MVDKGEVAAAVLVSTTKAEEIAHAAEQLARQPNFWPKLLYCDTCPHNKEFWATIFGQDLIGRLALFHFMHRIVESLQVGHKLYHKALQQLYQAIYDWDKEDFSELVRNLKQELMGTD